LRPAAACVQAELQGRQQQKEVRAQQQPRFSSTTLQDLSLTLGVVNLTLVTLVFDHTFLGDEALAILCPGLHRCSSLKQLSLVRCGLGPKAAKALAQALTISGSTSSSTYAAAGGLTAGRKGSGLNTEIRSSSFKASKPPQQQQQQQEEGGAIRGGHVHNGRERSSSSSSSKVPPQLQVLCLSGNSLAAIGLQHLLLALRGANDLQVSSGSG
jgi:hypothetical protein